LLPRVAISEDSDRVVAASAPVATEGPSSRKRSIGPHVTTPRPKRGRESVAADSARPSSSSRGAAYQPEWELSADDSALEDPQSAMQFLCHALLPKDYSAMDAAPDEEIMGSIAQTMYKVSLGPNLVVCSGLLLNFVSG
jgi:hypothetical protein